MKKCQFEITFTFTKIIMMLITFFFFALNIVLALAAPETYQASFLDSSAWGRFVQKSEILKLSTSPFYHHEKYITQLVRNMVNEGNEQRVVKLLSSVIEVEKAWRLHLCRQVFGVKGCSSQMSSEPFYLWKKTLVHNLRKDPTQEITTRIWHNLNKGKN